MHEDLARHDSDELVSGHAAVGTADPEEFGLVLVFQLAKKSRNILFDVLRPGLVVVEQLADLFHVSLLTVVLIASDLA